MCVLIDSYGTTFNDINMFTLTPSFAGSPSYKSEFEILIKELNCKSPRKKNNCTKTIIPPQYVQNRRIWSIISRAV